MLKLKNVLLKAGSKQSELAKALNLSQATVAQIVNHGEWPKSLDQAELQARIREFLVAAGADTGDVATAFEEADQLRPGPGADRPLPVGRIDVGGRQFAGIAGRIVDKGGVVEIMAEGIEPEAVDAEVEPEADDVEDGELRDATARQELGEATQWLGA